MAKCVFCQTETSASQCPNCGAIVTLPPSQVLKTLSPFPMGKAKITAAEPFAPMFRNQTVTLRGGPLDGKEAVVEVLKGIWPVRFTTIANAQVRSCVYELKADGPNRVYVFSKYKDSQ